MKKLIKKIYSYLIDIGFNKYVDDQTILKKEFKKGLGYELNLDNPKTYNEKLQWLKLYDRNPKYTTMVDKYEVKKYVSKIIGEEYIIPTLGIYNRFKDIDFDKLPNKFVIKCTHDSGGLTICEDKNNINKFKLKLRFNLLLKRNFYYRYREWPYKNVKPRIMIEEYVEDKKYNELRDYKFFCFNGNVNYMFVATNRHGKGETYFDFFDDKYNHLDIINGHNMAPSIPEKPLNFEKMKYIAKKLSKEIPHVRVDFYEVNGKVYFGELTFYHWSGFVPFNPNHWDKDFGKLINLDLVKKK